MTTKIKPDREDFEAVERGHGSAAWSATEKELGDRYRLAQAYKLIRDYGHPITPKVHRTVVRSPD